MKPKKKELTAKEMTLLNMWWLRLFDATNLEGRKVSAGELAKPSGFSQSTAKKYLEMLVKNGAAIKSKIKHWNGADKTVYVAVVGGE